MGGGGSSSIAGMASRTGRVQQQVGGKPPLSLRCNTQSAHARGCCHARACPAANQRARQHCSSSHDIFMLRLRPPCCCLRSQPPAGPLSSEGKPSSWPTGVQGGVVVGGRRRQGDQQGASRRHGQQPSRQPKAAARAMQGMPRAQNRRGAQARRASARLMPRRPGLAARMPATSPSISPSGHATSISACCVCRGRGAGRRHVL